LKEFRLKKNFSFACVRGKITIFIGHFPRIRKDKRRETIFLKFGAFLALSVQNRPKFGPRIVLPLHFLFSPF
jgi:hypothetical protein